MKVRRLRMARGGRTGGATDSYRHPRPPSRGSRASVRAVALDARVKPEHDEWRGSDVVGATSSAVIQWRGEAVEAIAAGDVLLHIRTAVVPELVPGTHWHQRLATPCGVFIVAFEEIGRAHVELQSLMRISYAVFCLKKNKYDRIAQHTKKTHTTSK